MVSTPSATLTSMFFSSMPGSLAVISYMPGPDTARGFVVTTLLGLAGAFLATAVGVETGILGPRQFSGIIGASIGAIIILYVWHRLGSAGLIHGHGLVKQPLARRPS